jgi:hypothetical protein
MADDQILLNGHYEIMAGERLPKLDSPGVEAFVVHDHDDPGRQLFALIPPVHLPCRFLGLLTKKPITEIPALWPRTAGIVDWPVTPSGGVLGGKGASAVWGRRPALIYDVPKGERAFPAGAKVEPLTEAQLVRQVIMPMIQALQEFSALGVPHRALRADNLFYQAGSDGPLRLGECFSMPPGFAQPVLYETIENASADPYGRGPGIPSDDLYALGVLLLVLHIGRNPTEGMSDEDVISAKITAGSFAALAGREKLSTTMAEVLRGLLNDKPGDRWSLQQLGGWALGQPFSPTMPHLPARASRPMRFGDTDYMTKPALAHAMSMHWPDAMRLIESPDFENWLKRSFNDDKVGERMAKLATSSASVGPGSAVKDRFLSRIIMSLSTQAPICYQNIRVNVTGLGTMLAQAMERQQGLTSFADMLRGRLPQVWVNEQPNLNAGQLAARRTLEEVEKHIEKVPIGYGLERALYELDALTPCRSPMIADFCVTHLNDLLPALDAALPGLPSDTVPIDRHIAAFIGAHMRRGVDHELGMLNPSADQGEPERRVAVLRLLAVVQQAYPNRNLPRLAEAMMAMLAPALARFHHARTRADAEKKMRVLAKDCDLAGLALIFDPEGPNRRADELGYTAAQRAYQHLLREQKWLEDGGLNAPERTAPIGQRAAAVTSAFIASAAIAAYSVFALL